MYTVWWVSEDFSERKILQKWTRLVYWERLNDTQPLEVLSFPHNVLEGVSLPDYARIQIHNGERLVWSGRLVGEQWGINEKGYDDVEFQGQDATYYAARMIVIPDHTYETTLDGVTAWPLTRERVIMVTYADDAMRDLVTTQMISPPETQRQHSDVRCEEYAGLGTFMRIDEGTDSLLQVLQELADKDGLWFRFVPNDTYSEFQVRADWGRDLTADYVVEQGRHNVISARVRRFYGTAENAAYGRAEGGATWLPQVLPVFDETSIAKWGVGEVLVGSTGSPADIAAATQTYLTRTRIDETVALELPQESYGRDWALGDKFSVRLMRGTREFIWTVLVKAVRVEVAATGQVTATPALEVLS